MIIRNNKRKLFSSALSFEEITSLSHEIAKKVISGELTKEEAIVEVMDTANWSYGYADAAVSSWIENEPTYNGMVISSARKPIKSAVKNKDLSNEEKDRLYEIEKREAEERYNQMDDFDKERLKKLYGIRNLRDYLKFFVVHPNKLGDDYEYFSGDPRKKLNSSRKPIKSGIQHKDVSSVSADLWKDGSESPEKNFSNMSIEVFNQDGDEVFYDFEDEQWYYYPTHKKALVKKWVEKKFITSSRKAIKSSLDEKLIRYVDEFEEGYSNAIDDIEEDPDNEELAFNHRLQSFEDEFAKSHNLTEAEINELRNEVESNWYEASMNAGMDVFASRKPVKSSSKPIKSEFDIGTRVYNQDYMGGKGKLWDKYGSVTKIIDDDTVEVKWDSGKKEERKTDSIYKVKETELSDVHNVKSSVGKKTNLPKNLVRQVLSNKITEDQAINRVMISQKCNRGVARVIFNRWMDQNRDSIIKSDAAIAEIQNEFNPDGNLDSWAEIYMPGSGKANTKGGELVRAAQRILAAYYASEAMIGRGLGNELVNPAARYIVENTEFELNSDIQEMLDHDIQYDDSEYDSWLKSFETKFEDYLRNNSELFSEANDDDMDDYRKDEDSEFFLNKCYVEDDNGNEYFIESEDGEWKCTDIVASNENAYSVGDEISEGDVFFEKVNKSEEYGSFEENGTTYFYEASGNADENGEFDTFKITEVQFTDQLFEKDSFVDYEKLEELCEDGKLFDVNGNQIHIEDFQRI